MTDEPNASDHFESSSIDPAQARWHVSYIEELDRSAGGGPAIAVLGWPEDEEKVVRLSLRGLPRLLIIGPKAVPVRSRDVLEDWVRLPVSDQDVSARLQALRFRAAQHLPRPWLDGSGRLMYQDRWVALSEIEERLAGVLVDRVGDVVPTRELLDAGWPAGAPRHWRPMISRLRRRCAEVGLDVTTVRGRGYGIQLTSRPVLQDSWLRERRRPGPGPGLGRGRRVG